MEVEKHVQLPASWLAFIFHRQRPRSAELFELRSNMTFDLLVGSYSPSLQVLHFDPAAKTLELSTLAQPAFERYTWISRHPTLKNIYYATQSPADGGDGIISPIKVIGGSGSAYQLEVLQSLPTGGSSPCHLGVKPDGSELGISNVRSNNLQERAVCL